MSSMAELRRVAAYNGAREYECELCGHRPGRYYHVTDDLKVGKDAETGRPIVRCRAEAACWRRQGEPATRR